MNPDPSPLFPSINYSQMLEEAGETPVVPFLREELPYVWWQEYNKMTPRKTNVCRFNLGTFEYLFDDYRTMEAMGEAPSGTDDESRLVAAIGTSNPKFEKRDDSRLKGWIGPTEKRFGKDWDKGHFIAHSIGGAVDQWEVNVFPQRRKLNRGWSKPGSVYRAMESFCAENPGVLFFARPVYLTPSFIPCILEFGILRPNQTWWIEQFDNR